MKLRIYNNSFRFRITNEDLQHLQQTGHVSDVSCHGGSQTPSFTTSIRVSEEAAESRFELEAYSAVFVLTPKDLLALGDPSQEGVYLEQVWEDDQGKARTSRACVEKDRGRNPQRETEFGIRNNPGNRSY